MIDSERPGVLQVVHTLSPGGTERLVIELSRRLAPRLRVRVCCLDDEGEWSSELTKAGVAVEALQRKPGFRPSLGRRIAAIAKMHDLHVLHCHQYSPFVYGAIATLVSPRLRLVFTEHGRVSDAPPSRKRQLVNPWLVRRQHVLCAVSGELRQHMLREGFPADDFRVVCNGIDAGAMPDGQARERARVLLGAAPGLRLLGAVGRLDPVKNLTLMIDAFARAARLRDDVKLMLIGDGPERARLEQHAAESGVRDRIQFLGVRHDARALMPAFDVLLNTSTTEGQSVTILEAMAAAVPVIATSVGGTPEVVVDGETGLLVPSRSLDPLVAAIVELLADPERARDLGLAGRRRLEERFTLDRMVADYERLYETALADRRTRRVAAAAS
jgi:glycosyltransferase involved in cell wall biosynthesis